MFETYLFRQLDVQPTLNESERLRILELTSFNFNEFYCNGDVRFCPEKQILYKANRLLEKYLDDMLEIQKTHNFEIVRIRLFFAFVKSGHISLLGQDWAKALSAYQNAYNINSDLFWRDPENYYGLGLVYLHFKEYKFAIDAFTRLLYSFPIGDHVVEAKARLAVCYHNIDDFSRAIKLYNQALLDKSDTPFMDKYVIRFNIALANENSKELSKAEEEYKKLAEDIETLIKEKQNEVSTPEQVKLQAAIFRQLGWIEYRRSCQDDAEKTTHIENARVHLLRSQSIDSTDGKSYYYLGRCFGEIEDKAHDAFVNYRQSIDKSEANADTWCSIGALYQKQTQPMDALQAFICAVELDPEHSAAWTDLGELYEKHAQFYDALECYKNAVKHNPCSPEPLKARIIVLEKELALPVPQKPAGQSASKVLPSLKDAWTQPIPSELRQRQEEFYRVKEQRYRDGSALWRMGSLAAPVGEQEIESFNHHNITQIELCKVLYHNRGHNDPIEEAFLDYCDVQFCMNARLITDKLLPPQMIQHLPQFTDEDIQKILDQSVPRFKLELKKGPMPNKPVSDLPNTFSLLAPVKVPYDTCAQEILELAGRRVHKTDFKPLFEEDVCPPSPPKAPKAERQLSRAELTRPTPLLICDTRKDVQSIELQKFCETTPIALVRGLTAVLKMDLSKFSTKALLDAAGADEMEVRTQYRMPSDLNVDAAGNPTWSCYSMQAFTTITKYAQYQAETFKISLKEEAEKLRITGAKYAQQMAAEMHGAKRRKCNGTDEFIVPMKTIKFGTNVDLSDDVKWKAQLQELSKMPPFCRLISGGNMLSHFSHQILGMNTVQLYMKVPGSRTPAHQENNCFASININIGPGDCEWFACPYEYWGVIEKLCRKNGIDFLRGSYWPNLDDLYRANVPIYRFTQKAGDLVYVGGGCVHWVQANGWCNNIAWNVGPMNCTQLTMSLLSYEFNKLNNYKSLVPIQCMAWQLAKNVRFTNQGLYTQVRGLLIKSLSFLKMVLDYAIANGKQVKPHKRTKGEFTHYCTSCEIEVFNILFVKENVNKKFTVFCVYCARTQGIDEFIVLQQVPISELVEIYDGMILNPSPNVPLTA
ncbi:unnamed protein product [Caenorhabditis bovis]|uniref:JmjC domain-containing protein n=1 Tax=Caenorhabditis bovis TaxID=2654633 RepID=A0A8S1E9Q5_9PELO|nr:unnamed protein product [Caenorhabditis bovis]